MRKVKKGAEKEEPSEVTGGKRKKKAPDKVRQRNVKEAQRNKSGVNGWGDQIRGGGDRG